MLCSLAHGGLPAGACRLAAALYAPSRTLMPAGASEPVAMAVSATARRDRPDPRCVPPHVGSRAEDAEMLGRSIAPPRRPGLGGLGASRGRCGGRRPSPLSGARRSHTQCSPTLGVPCGAVGPGGSAVGGAAAQGPHPVGVCRGLQQTRRALRLVCCPAPPSTAQSEAGLGPVHTMTLLHIPHNALPRTLLRSPAAAGLPAPRGWIAQRGPPCWRPPHVSGETSMRRSMCSSPLAPSTPPWPPSRPPAPRRKGGGGQVRPTPTSSPPRTARSPRPWAVLRARRARAPRRAHRAAGAGLLGAPF